jgi:endonuclease/exonuclease/phosphatase family metal-dependent hydrolase
VSLSVGTFNLNNLFSRFNYAGTVDALPAAAEGDEPAIVEEVTLRAPRPGEEPDWKRTFKGRLIMAKDPEDTERIAQRILAMDADVLCVQEVEHEGALKDFNDGHLNGRYPHLIVIDGNDPRLIDVGVLSKRPFGAATTWKHATHPDRPGERVFGRDLLEVEILDDQGGVLLTVFNTHLKSHYVDRWNFEEGRRRTPTEMEAEARKGDELRLRQADVVARLIGRRDRAVLAGDMNDPPDSPHVAPLPALGLVNALTAPTETRPRPDDPGDPPPASPAWTHRHKPSGKPAQYQLFDHVWVTPDLAVVQEAAHIDRRTRLRGDGSDHDPAWITLNL